MNLSAFHIRYKAPNACETAKMVEDLWSVWSWSADVFIADKADSKRNQMLRVVEAEER